MAELIAVGNTVINLDQVIAAECSGFGMEGAAPTAPVPTVTVRLAWTSHPMEFRGEEAVFLCEALRSLAFTRARLEGEQFFSKREEESR